MIIKRFESFALGFLWPMNACACITDKMQMAGQGNQREIIATFYKFCWNIISSLYLIRTTYNIISNKWHAVHDTDDMTLHDMSTAALLTNSWAPPISLILWSPSIELKNAYYSLKKPHKHFCSFLKLNFAFMLVLSIPSTTSTLNYTSVGTKPTTGRRHGMDWTLTTAKRCHFRFFRGHFGAFGGFGG